MKAELQIAYSNLPLTRVDSIFVLHPSSFINHSSILHQDDPIGKTGGEFVIVRDHQNRQRVLIDHLAQQRKQFVRAGRIEISGGLIRQQDFGIVRQRARDRHALLFAAGKF